MSPIAHWLALLSLGTPPDPATPLPEEVSVDSRPAKVDSRFRWLSPSQGSDQTPLQAALKALGPRAEASSALRSRPQLSLMDLHDTGAGPIVVRFRCLHRGLEIVGGTTSVVMSRDLEPIAVSRSSRQMCEAQGGAGSGSAWAQGVSAEEAVARAARAHGSHQSQAADWRRRGAGKRLIHFEGLAERLERSSPSAQLRRVFVSDDESSLEPAYVVHFGLAADDAGRPRAMSYLISARDGAIISSENRVDMYEPFRYRVYAESNGEPLEDPFGRNQPHPTSRPDGFVPSAPVTPNLISVAERSRRVDDPWLPDGAEATVGNNVDAFFNSIITPEGTFDFSLSLPASSAVFRPQDGDFRAQMTSPGEFDYVYDVSAAPRDYYQFPPTSPSTPVPVNDPQISAKIVHAFYVANYLHDLFYDAGFDEISGNAQEDNFGRGGLDGDRIALFVSFPGNFIFTPEDGVKPQIYLGLNMFSQTRRGFTLDVTVLGHEFAHLVVRRLIGGGLFNLVNKQGLALNEGWADFVGLLLLVDEAESPLDRRGTYASGAYGNQDYAFFTEVFSGTAATDAYYHGVRRYPYSVDFSKNPLTFAMVENGAPLPDSIGVSDYRGRSRYNSQVHSAGEVWAVSLWQCFEALLRSRRGQTYPVVRSIMIEYLVAGMKATPANPTFIEARDALLAVMKASSRRDFRVCRNALARRGFGAGAVAPPRDSRDLSGVLESFSRSNAAVNLVEVAFDDSRSTVDGDGILDLGEEGYMRVTLRNSGFRPLGPVVAMLRTSASYEVPNRRLVFGSSAPGEDMVARVPVRLLDDTPYGETTVRLRIVAPLAARLPERRFEARVRTHYDLARSSTTDDAEQAPTFGDWSIVEEGPFPERHPAHPRWRRRSREGNFVYQAAEGYAGYEVGLESPPLHIGSGQDFTIEFDHAYKFDKAPDPVLGTFKGEGRIQISNDNGETWVDLSALTGEGTFGGTSSNYPEFRREVFNLGRALSGTTVRVRFFADFVETYAEEYLDGWFIDNISFGGVDNLPFTRILPHGARH